MTDTDIAIIGSGVAGLACARRLVASGLRPTLFDKGRGIGGRVATRRVYIAGHELSFDHGAQYFTVRDPEFSAQINAAGHDVARWEDTTVETRLVGTPGMASLPKALAIGLNIKQQVEVKALRQHGPQWLLETNDEEISARQLVMTIPPLQAARLLGETHPLNKTLATIEMAPCLTLMAAFAPEVPRPFVSLSSDTQALTWIAQDSAKPGRNSALTAWVAQASPRWSALHLDEAPEVIAARMLPLLADAIGARPELAFHSVAHRWRYARVVTPLGQPFLRNDIGNLWLAGDWCLGARVEAAWRSGDAIGRELLAIDSFN